MLIKLLLRELTQDDDEELQLCLWSSQQTIALSVVDPAGKAALVTSVNSPKLVMFTAEVVLRFSC